MTWNEDQKWESNWWGSCINTYWEETKQMVYARKMGLHPFMEDGKYPVIAVSNKVILDIGGGPTSMLLKCINLGHGVVIDPCKYPSWIEERYNAAWIGYTIQNGESIGVENSTIFDEVWIYNVLQHTQDPQKIITNARKISKIIRIFEWVDTDITPGHPHSLKADKLDEWLGGIGKVEDINESGCHGRCYYGIFKGDHYETK